MTWCSPVPSLSVLLLLSLGAAGCAPITPVFTSTEPRIWVVRGGNEVYRCADMAEQVRASDGTIVAKAPRPVCVLAERLEGGR